MQRIHCVGIGGIGISAIARVLSEQGYQVTGSDLCLSPVAQALRDSGVEVHVGHQASQVGDADVVLVSSAIPETNPEVAEAHRRGVPVCKRSEFLGQMMAGKIGVAVAGTHGKTTTTSMLAWVLVEAGLDPTFIIGGVMQALQTNARAGAGHHFVIEADEYDHMFLGLKPVVAVVTHLEHDHPDCYPTFAHMESAFGQFLDLVPAEGLVIGCGDQPAVVGLLAQDRPPARLICGLGRDNDWRAVQVVPNSRGGHDLDIVRNGTRWGHMSLGVPGVHNVQNALLAAATAHWLGVDGPVICRALESFAGVERRFEALDLPEGVTVVDDYAHHPTKIRATLSAARTRYGDRPIWAVFQPHTYSRVKALWTDFTHSFGSADHVIVLDVYAAREKDTLGVSAKALAAQIDHRAVTYIPEIDAAVDHLVRHLEPGDVVITLSAGDGNQVGTGVTERWHRRTEFSEAGLS